SGRLRCLMGPVRLRRTPIARLLARPKRVACWALYSGARARAVLRGSAPRCTRELRPWLCFGARPRAVLRGFVLGCASGLGPALYSGASSLAVLRGSAPRCTRVLALALRAWQALGMSVVLGLGVVLLAAVPGGTADDFFAADAAVFRAAEIRLAQQ